MRFLKLGVGALIVVIAAIAASWSLAAPFWGRAAPPQPAAARPAATAAPGGGTIGQENALPGTADWQISKPSRAGEIQGYAGQVSVQPGDTVDVYVSTKGGANFDVSVYRMGWYSGAGGREVFSLRDVRGFDQGHWDPQDGLQGCGTCAVDASTLLVDARWRRTLGIETRRDWLSGYYLIKLRELSTNTESYAPFIVRDDSSHAAILVQAPTNTWQAYNTWGDASLYGSFGATRKYVQKTRRAYRVSYDRPYDPTINEFENDGAGEFLSWEYDFVRWAESRGYDLTYTTNVDVAARPQLLREHRLFVSLGHDEYWTREERDGVEAARDSGVNLAFFGGNDAYWQARLEPSANGVPGRILTVYKDAKKDPLAATQPNGTTVRFSDPPLNRPTSPLTGVAFGSNATPAYQPWRAAAIGSWFYAGTGIRAGDAFRGIVGYEYDRLPPGPQRPPGLTVVGKSAVDGFMGRDIAVSTLYTAPGGAQVFAAGTIAWSWGLDNFGHVWLGAFADARLQRLTANIMNRLGAAPTGR